VLWEDLEELGFSEVVKRTEALDRAEGDWLPLKLAFLRNITIDPMIPYLKYLCYQDGMQAKVFPGEYDTVVQSVIQHGSSLYGHEPDVIAVCLKMENLSDTLATGFSALTAAEIDSEVDRVLGLIDRILHEIREKCTAAVLVHNFETPVHPSYGILDYQDRGKQVGTFRRINERLLQIAGKHDGVYLVDLDLLQSAVGYRNFFDHRYWHVAKSPYTREAWRAIAGEYVKFLRALCGKKRKCLVLDCDYTLWGGIVGEDRPGGIRIGTTYPGSAYRDFQKAVLDLYHRGVMLAICSKNNEADVLAVLDDHPDMLLRRNHFAAMRIDWNHKIENLRSIAAELNIGTDSLVFVDDSPVEIGQVRRLLPEVKTIQLAGDPGAHVDQLRAAGWFDGLTFSDEDRRRNRMYQDEIRRKDARRNLQTGDVEDYFRYLAMEVRIGAADVFTVPRAAELTQRTNQFNLTTRRYTEAQIRQLAEADDSDVLVLRLKDRFGDSGIVGVAVLRYDGPGVLIDTFLLSCRVIGRGVEDVLLKTCLDAARARGCERVTGLYLPTKKNAQVASFYRDRQFARMADGTEAARYQWTWDRPARKPPGYFASIEVDPGLLSDAPAR